MILFFTGCMEEKEKPVTKVVSLKKLTRSQYPDFSDKLDKAGLIDAIEQSLIYFSRIPGTKKFYFGKDIFTGAHIKKSLTKFLSFIKKEPSQKELNNFVRDNYAVYKSPGRDDKEKVLFTGYYEPSLAGSLTRDAQYRYPLYSEPDDLLTINLKLFSDRYREEPKLLARVDKNNNIVPYYSRQEINAIENFEERAQPVAWVKSRTDRFFLEIQGSGKVLLKQGDFLRVHYHRKNGRKYRSIGKVLIDKKEIAREDISMQSIRAWLENNPLKAEEVFNYNPSFVFFKKEEKGPLGCLGVKVTPMRSIATDRSLFPKGSLCFIETFIPLKNKTKKTDTWKKYSGFVLNQDAGGAIKGPGRTDFFYGNGGYAEFAAGHMNHPGNLYFLVLK